MLMVQILFKPWNNVSWGSEGSKSKLSTRKATRYLEYVPIPVGGMYNRYSVSSVVEKTNCSQLVLKWGICLLKRWHYAGDSALVSAAVSLDIRQDQELDLLFLWGELISWGTCIASIPAQIATSFICPLCQHQGSQWHKMPVLVINRFSHFI